MTESLIRSLSEQIAYRLQQEILSGKLKPNEPLREQDIAGRFNVSRGPIREVFRQLSQQGLLVTEPNKGVRVAELLTGELRPLITCLRFEIESFVLSALFDHITAEQIAAWEQILGEIEAACRRNSISALIEADLKLHHAFVSAYTQADLLPVWQPVVLRMMMDYRRHADLMESFYEHRRIVQAIAAGDQVEALAALKANIR